MKNIVLIGMPGAGKSTIGVILAKALGFPFIDTDLLIQTEHEKLLPDIIKEDGMSAFLQIEENTLHTIDLSKHIIATGGSAVYSEKGMRKLMQNSIIVYLNVSMEKIEERIKCISCRGIVIDKDKTLQDLFQERDPLYKKYAHYIIECDNKSTEEIVDAIIEQLKSGELDNEILI